jgi:aldose 1-epimerase
MLKLLNHSSYFNLSSAPTIEGTEVTLTTTKYLEVDDTDIPTEVIGDFPGLEANKTFTLGATEPDIDHCFVLDPSNPKIPLDTRSLEPRLLISLFHPGSGIHLEVFSTEPAFQFYTGKYIDVAATSDRPARGKRAGMCIEPSRYINAINVPEWRDQMLLKKNNIYGAKTVYKAWK